jgi:hypothetical protein
MPPEDQTGNVEVTQPLQPVIRHVIVPPVPEASLTNVEGQVVQIETQQLPTPEEVQRSLSAGVQASLAARRV